MARTGGNCGLLLALVSPVGCKSRNAGSETFRASNQATLGATNPSSSLLLVYFPQFRVTVARSPLPRRLSVRLCVITRVTVTQECESRLSNALTLLAVACVESAAFEVAF